jgi:hypothetical protein
MGRDKMPTFVLAAAIVVGALVWVGVPLAALALPLILLACPLMMIFMMRGMNHDGGQGGHGGGCHGNHAAHQGTEEHEGHEPAARPVSKDSVR